jgi:8-amino-7-oxononanoate synthase
MNPLDAHLIRRMANTEAAGLRRSLRDVSDRDGVSITVDGRSLTNFSSNDYLGLANHPELIEAARRSVQDWGSGSGAARLVCGSLRVFRDLEEALADWKGCAAALSFSTGYAAALGTVPAVVGPGDVVVIDKRVHACCVDAARLSGATLRVFRHNDLDDLERILVWARKPSGEAAKPAQILVITESVFSMDGDEAPLRELVELKDRHGAWLMLDEAHATGLYGTRRTGLAEAAGVSDRIDIHMGTLGKALGSSGGYIAGSAALRDHLINHARSFIFSTAPVPAAPAAALAAVRLIQTDEGSRRVAQLYSHLRQLRESLPLAPEARAAGSAILPVLAGAEGVALEWSSRLRDAGLLVPAIRYPTVARGAARLRITVSADHDARDLQHLIAAVHALPAPASSLPSSE